jgi:hypothetical protein
MKLYERKATLVRAWKVPLWGHVADEPAPHWLTSRMNLGEVRVNARGGLTAQYVYGTRGCNAGDYIVLTEEDEIDFCPADRFEDRYFEVKQAQAA